jgi:hypothetical protein
VRRRPATWFSFALLLAFFATRTFATPTISITSPTTGSPQNLTGTPPSLTINATAAIGSSPAGTLVSSVNFLVNGTSIGTVGGGAFGGYSITWFPTAPGTYTLTAQVTDTSVVTSGTNPNLNTATSPLVIVTVTGAFPSVSLSTTPSATSFGLGSTVTLSATATPTSGATVSRVDFLSGSTVIGSAFAASGGVYSFSWIPSTAGAISLTARVTDTAGYSATSTATIVNITVPGVTLTSPLSGAGLTVGTSVTLTASAFAVSPATVAKVDFLNGTTLIGTATSPPYSVNWTPTTAGNVSLTARVTDSNGAPVTSAAVSVTVSTPVSTPNSPPSITLSSPANGDTLALGAATTLQASPSAGTGATILRVDFLAGTTTVGTVLSPPYSFSWTPTATGVVALTAKVTDSNGSTATSVAVNATVTGPTIALTSPTNGASLAVNSPVTISANASAAGAATVARVEFFAGTTSLGIATAAPYAVTWTPTAAGSLSLTARLTDSNGATVTSAAVPVTVAVDPTQITLALSISPGVSTLPVGATRNLLATATAPAGRAIQRVEFFLDGVKVGEKGSAPFNFRYTPTAVGTYVFTALASDNAGSTRDAQLTLTVVSAVGAKPTVALATPANNTTVAPNTAVNLTGAAFASGGSIAAVQFYVNGGPVGSTLTGTPYSVSYTPASPGSYVVDLIAMDDRANSTASGAATLLAAFPAPAVTLTAPKADSTGNVRVTPNVPLTLTATATGGGGASVLTVEFLVDGTAVATRTAPTSGTSYTATWTPTTAQFGAHSLVARVTDANSQTVVSSGVTLNVANIVGTPPTVSISTPANNANLQSLSVANFVANAFASGSGNSLTSVEFFLNDVSLGLGTREQATNFYRLVYNLADYDFSSVATDANGRYPLSLYAIAKDANGNQTASAAIALTVTPATSAAPTVALAAQGTPSVTQGTAFPMIATLNDPDGTVTSLQLFVNGAASGSAIPNPGPQATVTFTPTAAGRFNLYVVATDDTGNTAVSSPAIALNVTAVTTPVTSVTRPSDDTTVTNINTPVFLEAAASSPDSATLTVSFIAVAASGARTTVNATQIGTSTTYRAVWTPTVASTYTITSSASVPNAAGVTGTSANARRVSVTGLSGLAPTVTISTPNAATTASTANFTATAADFDGSVVSVEFFLNRNTIGQATRDLLTNTWRITATFANLTPGAAEIVALARDSAGNLGASPTNSINVSAASSLPPTITISASSTNVAFSRQVQLTASARDSDGNVNTVQYFANGTSLGSTGNAGTNYLVNWTPNQAGTFNVWAVATDDTGNTRVASALQVTVRPNNPVQEDDAFILQAYTDVANATVPNALVFANLSAQMAAGTLTRAQLVTNLTSEAGFTPPANLLAAYYAIMGQWPTPANYTTLLATARTSLPNAIGAILSSPEYVAKFGPTPTAATFNANYATFTAFATRLWQNTGLGAPSTLQVFQFQNNDTLLPTLGRGYAAVNNSVPVTTPPTLVGLNPAIAEFITNTSATNAAFLKRARAAALYYQLDRPPVSTSTDDIAARVTALAQLPDTAAIAAAVLQDQLYAFRYVTITVPPQSVTVAAGATAIFTVTATGAPPLNYQWYFNGSPITGATGSALSVSGVSANKTGAYYVVVSSPVASATSPVAILALASGGKVTGASLEVARDVPSKNNIYDQILLRSDATTVTADPGQVTRLSFIDLNDDIVQVEFSGAGALTLALDDASGPAQPLFYNQPDVAYMKGHAQIVITDADETTNVSVFSVGRFTALNQALFRDDVTYDGMADIGCLAILSANGKFGGVRTGNTSYFATKGYTGVYAPDVQFTGPVFVGDIRAHDDATPVLLLGSADDVRITGGNLAQANDRAVQVSGIATLKFTDGMNSQGKYLPAQTNHARLEQNGVDVTASVASSSGP